jgi:hypothetical protein
MAEAGITELAVRDGVMKARPVPSLLDSQEVRLARLYPGSTYKPVTGTLIIPAPGKDLIAWVLATLRGLLKVSNLA